jgi:hypothetical protein
MLGSPKLAKLQTIYSRSSHNEIAEEARHEKSLGAELDGPDKAGTGEILKGFPVPTSSS